MYTQKCARVFLHTPHIDMLSSNSALLSCLCLRLPKDGGSADADLRTSRGATAAKEWGGEDLEPAGDDGFETSFSMNLVDLLLALRYQCFLVQLLVDLDAQGPG